MPGWETIVVGVVVAAALAWALRGVLRAVRQKRVCSDCASSGGCPVAQGGAGPAPGSACRTDLFELGPTEEK
jgi:hypothetical protein